MPQLPRRALGSIGALLFSACAGQRSPRTEAPVEARSVRADCTIDTACPAGSLCIFQRCASIGSFTGQCFGLRVPFAAGTTEVGQTTRPSIGRLARCLRAGHRPVVLLREHTAPEKPVPVLPVPVGDARATAVAAELLRLGVPVERQRQAHYTTGHHLACPEGWAGCTDRRIDWSAERLEAARQAAPPG